MGFSWARMRRITLIIVALCLYGGAGGAVVAAVLPASIDIDFRETAVWGGATIYRPVVLSLAPTSRSRPRPRTPGCSGPPTTVSASAAASWTRSISRKR